MVTTLLLDVNQVKVLQGVAIRVDSPCTLR